MVDIQKNTQKLKCVAASCQANDSVVAVLEKVASLDDKEEVARLAGEAKGRKSSVRIKSCSPPNTQKAFLASGFPLISKLVGSVNIV